MVKTMVEFGFYPCYDPSFHLDSIHGGSHALTHGEIPGSLVEEFKMIETERQEFL